MSLRIRPGGGSWQPMVTLRRELDIASPPKGYPNGRDVLAARCACAYTECRVVTKERPGGNDVRRLIFSLFCLSVGGCASHTWTPGPGVSMADFEPTKARCSLMASNSGGGFAAYGSQNFVAGAALGNAVGESVRANRT